MAPITTKEELLTVIQKNRYKLEKELAQLTPEEMEMPLLFEGQSVKDILAHLYDWQLRHFGWIDAVKRGETPEVPAPGLTWKGADVDLLNHQIREAHRAEPLEETLAKFRSVYAEFILDIKNASDEELFTPGYYPFTGNGTLVRWLTHYSYHDGWGRRYVHQVRKLLGKTKRGK
jgi:hypothetical protein